MTLSWDFAILSCHVVPILADSHVQAAVWDLVVYHQEHAEEHDTK